MSDYRYVLVREPGWFELERGVNEMIEDGYVPMGGPIVEHGEWVQAVYKKAGTAKRQPKQEFAPPPGVDPRVWDDYLKHRSEKRKGMTPTAYSRLCKSLQKWLDDGLDINASIVNSIRNGWTGVFEPKGKKKTSMTLDYVPDNELDTWAKRVGAPAPKAQAGYDYAAYRKDLEAWVRSR